MGANLLFGRIKMKKIGYVNAEARCEQTLTELFRIRLFSVYKVIFEFKVQFFYCCTVHVYCNAHKKKSRISTFGWSNID